MHAIWSSSVCPDDVTFLFQACIRSTQLLQVAMWYMRQTLMHVHVKWLGVRDHLYGVVDMYFMLCWALVEPLRLLCGYHGNLREQVVPWAVMPDDPDKWRCICDAVWGLHAVMNNIWAVLQCILQMQVPYVILLGIVSLFPQAAINVYFVLPVAVSTANIAHVVQSRAARQAQLVVSNGA